MTTALAILFVCFYVVLIMFLATRGEDNDGGNDNYA